MKGKGSKTRKAALRAPLALAKDQSPFARIEDAVEAIRAGRMVIVVDDPDRENEGDLTIAAEKVTPDAINFMARYGRGQICLSMTGARLDELEIPLAVHANTTPLGTAFCVPIDAKHRRRRPASPRPTAPRPCWRRSIRRPSRPISPGRVTVSRCARATAASWCAPVRPRPPSIWRGSPGCIPPA